MGADLDEVVVVVIRKQVRVAAGPLCGSPRHPGVPAPAPPQHQEFARQRLDARLGRAQVHHAERARAGDLCASACTNIGVQRAQPACAWRLYKPQPLSAHGSPKRTERAQPA